MYTDRWAPGHSNAKEPHINQGYELYIPRIITQDWFKEQCKSYCDLHSQNVTVMVWDNDLGGTGGRATV